MGRDFWDQVGADTAALLGCSEVATEFLIIDGECTHSASGIFEHSYTDRAGDGPVPVPSRYIALKVYEPDMPVRITSGMQIELQGKRYTIGSIREPGRNGITLVELRG